MKLSAKAKYALRCMIELALREGEGAVQLKAISRAQQISHKYLEQITIPLRNAGLINSERGSCGGYGLAKPASQISALQILQAVEGSLDILECISMEVVCKRTSECAARKLWKKVNNAMVESLAETSLAELRDNQRAASTGSAEIYYI